MHCTGIHFPGHDAPNPRDHRGKVQIQWMLSEGLPQCWWRRVDRLALKPHPRGGDPDCGGVLHPCLWVIHLICREHHVCVSLLCAACPLPSQHCRLVNALVEAGVGLRHPSLWPGFCRIWSYHCSLPALNNGPNSQKVQIRISWEMTGVPYQIAYTKYCMHVAQIHICYIEIEELKYVTHLHMSRSGKKKQINVYADYMLGSIMYDVCYAGMNKKNHQPFAFVTQGSMYVYFCWI